MKEIEQLTGKLTDIQFKKVRIGKQFIDIAARFAREPGTTVLMSGGDLDCSRHHILGIRPWLTFSGKNNLMTISNDHESSIFEGNPFDILKTILDSCKLDKKFDAAVPVGSGLMGYLSYDLKDYLEKLPRTSVDDLNLPVIHLNIPSVILVHDKESREETICAPVRNGIPLISLDDAERREQRLALERRWGILFQQGALFSSLTVLQNVQFPLRENLDLAPELLSYC